MKRIFAKNKLKFILLLGMSPLFSAIDSQKHTTIHLLKKTDLALEGWSKLQDKWLWSGKARQSRISSCTQELKNAQRELATALAGLDSDPNQDYQEVLRKSTACLTECAPPSHLRRNWIRYSATAVGLIGGAYVLSQYGYDDKGNHIAENFYKNHIKEPIANMYNILTNNNTDLTVLEQDTSDALRRFQDKLNLFIENSKNDAQLSQIVINHIPQHIPIEEVSLKNKLAFLDATLTFIHTHVPAEAMGSFKTFKVWNWGDIPHLHDALNSHILLLQQLRVEKMLATNKIDKVSQKIDLSIELIAAIPALVASYFCFKSIGKYFAHYRINTTYKPLKKMLIKLQLQCNQERYTNISSPGAEGMSIYWLSQLRESACYIPVADRTAYNDYLDQLEDNTLRPEQKITIVENMFRDIACLQKV